MAYRVEELAAVAGVSVELLRSYQTKGLVDPPRREGRVPATAVVVDEQ